MKRLPLLLLSGLAVAAMAACGGKKPETTPAPVGINADSAAEADRLRADSIARAEREAKDREEAERRRQQQIADSLAALGKSTEAVRALLATMIHFDYDKALGNRRATAAKQYVVSHGIDGSRIETVSYGEERPLAQGHDEDAWAQNRRDEFEILDGGDHLKQP